MKSVLGALVMAVTLAGVAWWFGQPREPAPWSAEELTTLGSLWIGALTPLPPSAGNTVADDPLAAELGQRLFFDLRLSADGTVACSTCHQPARRFTDGLARGRGLAEVSFNTMSLVGAAYSPWYFWNGRKDSLWSQALAPLENVDEHGSSRTSIVSLVTRDPVYRASYTALFGAPPDLARLKGVNASPIGDPQMKSAWEAMSETERASVNEVFANLGKALAAYQRLLQPGPSRFDDYVGAVLDNDQASVGAAFDTTEVEGLRLFIGKAQCTNCHNGPLLTNFEFHNTGVLPAPGLLPDKGRIIGVDLAREDPFNCLGAHSDATPDQCAELRFARSGDELIGAQKVPSLRNLSDTAPYMHAGQVPDLAEVIAHYDRAAPAVVGHNEAKPLGLRPYERRRLAAFLDTLDAPIAAEARWLAAPAQLD